MKNLNLQNMRQNMLVFILSLGIPLVLYWGRHLDDNRLTSWYWVFDNTEDFRLPVLLAAGVVAAFVVVKIRLQWSPSYLFFLTFLAVVPFWGVPEVIVDATRYFTQAKALKIHGLEYFLEEWGRNIYAWTDLPFIPMLYGLVFKVVGENRIGIQILNSLFFSGSVMLTYRLGEVLWNEELGRYGGFLLLGIPYIYTQVPLMLIDVPTMFFLLLAIFSFTCYLLEGGLMRFVATSLVIFFAIFAKYSVWVFLSVFGVIFLVILSKVRYRVVIRTSLVLGAVLLLAGLTYLFFREVMTAQIELLVSYQKPGLKRWGESFISTFFFQINPLLTATALLSAGAAFIRRDAKYLIISFLVVLFLLLQVNRSRYAIPVFPMLALMSSYGIMQLRNQETRRLLVACIVFTSFFISLGSYLPFLGRMSANNPQQAGKYLDEQNISAAGVVVFPQQEHVLNPLISVPLLDIYTASELVLLKNEEKGILDRQKVMTSPLRFTWEYPIPAYYTPGEDVLPTDGLVIIANSLDQTLPQPVSILAQKFKEKKIFSSSTGKFIYKTIVTVYH